MTMLPVVVLFLFDYCGFLFFLGGGEFVTVVYRNYCKITNQPQI